MLTLIFFEISIVVVSFFGIAFVLNKFVKTRAPRVFYVFLLLAAAVFGIITSLYSQIGYNLEWPKAYLGYAILIYSCYTLLFFIWIYLSELLKIKNIFLTIIIFLITILGLFLFLTCKVELALESGLIVPVVTGEFFPLITWILAVVMGFEQLVAFYKFYYFIKEHKFQYKVIRMSGISLVLLLFFMFTYFYTRITLFFVFAWINVFLAMLFLFLSEVIPEDSELLKAPLNFFRTRILFKLVIVLVIMVVFSLEGISIVLISVSKNTLASAVIRNYKQVAEDTVLLINSSNIKKGGERETLDSIAKLLLRTKIGSRGTVFLSSPSGNFYINREDSWVSLGVSNAKAAKDLLKNIGGGGEINIFGENIIAAYQPISKLGWGIIVGQPVAYAYEKIKQMEGVALIFAFFWIGLTVLIGLVFTKTIEGPIREMEQGIKKIGQGDLGYKIKTNKLDEIGELANTVNQMSTELKSSQESLLRSERLSALGFMAAGMAHEIKNALVPLRTLTDLLTISGKDQSFIAKFNELVPKEIERINKLSSDLLLYSKPSEPVFEYLNLNEIMEESVKFLEMQARTKNVKLKFIASKISDIKADRQQIMEVFTNLILNAIEAMNGGTIELSSYENDESIIAKVADNGPGIPKESLKTIFLPFFTTKKEGTGMGLAIVQRIMLEHGGTVEIKSSHEAGTTFLLIFRKKS